MATSASRKKIFVELENVSEFMARQASSVRHEYQLIVEMLEANGRLSMPEGEKISGEGLFVIRVIRAGNVRIFYAYGAHDYVFGLHAYEKKTREIPDHEMKRARQLLKKLNEKEALR